MAFEELDFALMLLGGFAGFEGAKVAALAGFGVGFAGVEAIFAGFEFADHCFYIPRALLIQAYRLG